MNDKPELEIEGLVPQVLNTGWNRRLVFVLIAVVVSTAVAFMQLRWSMEITSACYDLPGGFNGTTRMYEIIESGWIWLALVMGSILCAIPSRVLRRKINYSLAVVALLLFGITALWFAVSLSAMKSSWCPTGMPPDWPSWIPLWVSLGKSV